MKARDLLFHSIMTRQDEVSRQHLNTAKPKSEKTGQEKLAHVMEKQRKPSYKPVPLCADKKKITTHIVIQVYCSEFIFISNEEKTRENNYPRQKSIKEL